MSQIAIFTEGKSKYYYDVGKSGWPRICVDVINRRYRKKLLARPYYNGQEPSRPETDDLDTLKLWIQQMEAHMEMKASYEQNMKSWPLVEEALKGNLKAAVQFMETQGGWTLVDLSEVPKSVPWHVNSQEERRKALTDLLLRASREPLSGQEIQKEVQEINRIASHHKSDPHPYDKGMEQRIEVLVDVLFGQVSEKPTLTSQERVGEVLVRAGVPFDWATFYEEWIARAGGMNALAVMWFKETFGKKPEGFQDDVRMNSYVGKVRSRKQTLRGSDPEGSP